MFFSKPLAEKNVINDKDKDLISFYRDLKNNGCKTPKSCKLPTTKKQFEKLNTNNACGFLGKVVRSYGCNRKQFLYNSGSSTCQNLKKQCNDHQSMLKRTKILNDDFETVMKKHNNKNTFAYIDPPYVGSEKKYKEHKDISPERISKVLKDFEGKFLVSYNNEPSVREAFKDFKIEKVPTEYQFQRSITKRNKPVKELLIRNY